MALQFQEAKATLEGRPRWKAGRMYAIAFDLDTELLAKNYPSPAWNDAYRDIRDGLREFGFEWQQGSVQFGGGDPLTCVRAVRWLARRYDWFAACVRDIRMLRIEENNDLMPALAAEF